MIKLMPHQERALHKVKDFKHVGLYLDMGLGKTFAGSERLKYNNNKNNLVLCQHSKLDDWYQHFIKFYDYKTFKIATVKDLEVFMECNSKKVAIINYEKVRSKNYSLLNDLNDFTLMIDESSILCNPKTDIVKAVRKYKYNNLILLSGTPVSGKYENLWPQLSMLGWKITESKYNETFLNRRLVKRFGRRFYEIDKKDPYKNVERLKRRMKQNGCILMKTEEVFDLPDQNFIDVKVKNTKEYAKYLKDKYLNVGDKDLVGDTTLTFRLGLRQICSIYNKNKQQVLKDLINSTEDRLIIFYNFKDECKSILKCIPKDRPTSVVSGDEVNKANYITYENSITLMQYQAGAKGHNMQLANKLIFYSPTEKVEDWMQSAKRIHRIGQEKKCFYYKLIVENSIEEKIYQSLERGENYTDELFREV